MLDAAEVAGIRLADMQMDNIMLMSHTYQPPGSHYLPGHVLCSTHAAGMQHD